MAIKNIKSKSSSNLIISVEKNGYKVSGTISTYSYMEDDLFYVYSPELDLAGYDKTKRLAQKSFKIHLDFFFSYSVENNTLAECLTKLGWKKSKSKFEAPSLEVLINSNKQYSEVLKKDHFEKEQLAV
jgi:hypothetical protein